jgi:hypothetical protein
MRLTEDQVEFVVIAEPEDISVEDGGCAHEDCEECHQLIYDQLEMGNEWAWCCAHVIARWKQWEGHAYLGCCSYKSKEGFCQPGDYYDDMKQEALEELNKRVSEAWLALTEDEE